MKKPLLLLIHPAALKDSCRSTRRRKSSVAQLNLLVIAAYARKYFEVRIIDENIEDIDEEVPADLVGIKSPNFFGSAAFPWSWGAFTCFSCPTRQLVMQIH